MKGVELSIKMLLAIVVILIALFVSAYLCGVLPVKAGEEIFKALKPVKIHVG